MVQTAHGAAPISARTRTIRKIQRSQRRSRVIGFRFRLRISWSQSIDYARWRLGSAPGSARGTVRGCIVNP